MPRDKKTTVDLGNAPVWKLLARFFCGTLIALVFYSLYSITDALMLSWGVGENAVGAVSVATPFVMFQSAVSTAVGGGAAALISVCIGKGELERGGQIARTARLTFWAIAIIVSAIGLMLRDAVLRAFGVTAELYEGAKAYFTVILIGNVFSTGFSAMIRAEGKMIYGALIWVIPITVNLILDAIFIFVLSWGIGGAALATVLSQAVSFAMSILFFARFSVLKFRKTRWNFADLKEVLTAGAPSLVQNLALSAVLILFNNLLKRAEGTDAINAFSYAFRILSLAIIPITAVMQAAAPVAGFNYGIGANGRVKETFRVAILMALGAAVLVLITLEAGANLWMKAFTADTATQNAGAYDVRILAAALPFLAPPLIGGAILQAIGKKKFSLLLFSLPVFGVLCTSIWMGIVWGTDGILWSFPLGNLLACLPFFGNQTFFRKRKFGSKKSNETTDK